MSEERPVLLAQGGVDRLRELRDALRAAGVPAELVRPPGPGGG